MEQITRRQFIAKMFESRVTRICAELIVAVAIGLTVVLILRWQMSESVTIVLLITSVVVFIVVGNALNYIIAANKRRQQIDHAFEKPLLVHGFFGLIG